MKVGDSFQVGNISITQQELQFSMCWTDGTRSHMLGCHTSLRDGIDQELELTSLDKGVKEDLCKFREIAKGLDFDLDALAEFGK